MIVADADDSVLFACEAHENGCGDSIGCKQLERQQFSATRLLGASDGDQNSPKERWFAVGLHPQRLAEVAVCNLPLIESTNVVFVRRPLKPAEIEMLRLRRGEVVECSVSNDTIPETTT